MDKIDPDTLDPGFWTKTSWIQLGYGVWVNLTQVGIGLAFGFQALTVAQLLTEDSLMVANAESWIASVLTLSAPIGCLISGSIMDHRGRRVMLLVCQVPMFVGWFYTGLATTTGDVIIGRIITGVGCGMAIVPSRIYTTEMCLPNMRGVIGIFPDIAIAVGITIQAGLGSVILWSTSCFIYGFYSMGLIIVNYFLPETPYYVLMEDDTENDLKFTLANFRSRTYDLDSEYHEMIDFKFDNTIRRLNGKEKWKALIKKSTCQPFGITTVYFIISELSGVNVIMLWTIEILAFSNSSMEPHEGNLLLALTRLIMGVCTSMLLFKIGKTPMALVSAIGVGSVCIGLGSYLHYNMEPTIVPQICYIAYIGFATLGYYTLPYLIMTEVYPLQIRGFMVGISVAFVSFIMFANNKCYPYIKELLGFANTLIMFGVSSLLGSLFLYLYLPETQMLTLQDIEEYYNDRRPTLVSHRRVMSLQLRDASSKSLASFSRHKDVSKSTSSQRKMDSEGKHIKKIRKRLSKKKQKKEDENEHVEPPKGETSITLGSITDSENYENENTDKTDKRKGNII